MDLERLKQDLNNTYATVVSESQMSKINREILSEYDRVDEFDLNTESDEAIEYMMDYYDNSNIGVILRNFEKADKDVKEEISPKIKAFSEMRPPDKKTGIFIVGDANPVIYCPELGMRVKFMNK
jgi:hypothetical protein